MDADDAVLIGERAGPDGCVDRRSNRRRRTDGGPLDGGAPVDEAGEARPRPWPSLEHIGATTVPHHCDDEPRPSRALGLGNEDFVERAAAVVRSVHAEQLCKGGGEVGHGDVAIQGQLAGVPNEARPVEDERDLLDVVPGPGMRLPDKRTE
jgi:hypothetical protein